MACTHLQNVSFNIPSAGLNSSSSVLYTPIKSPWLSKRRLETPPLNQTPQSRCPPALSAIRWMSKKIFWCAMRTCCTQQDHLKCVHSQCVCVQVRMCNTVQLSCSHWISVFPQYFPKRANLSLLTLCRPVVHSHLIYKKRYLDRFNRCHAASVKMWIWKHNGEPSTTVLSSLTFSEQLLLGDRHPKHI